MRPVPRVGATDWGGCVDIVRRCKKNACGGVMKRMKGAKELRVERPHRAVVSEKEALKRMREFSKRKEQFLGTARTGKGRSVRP